MLKTKRWLVVISVVLMLVVASSGVIAAQAPPMAHCHSSNPHNDRAIRWVDQEAMEIAEIVMSHYQGVWFEDMDILGQIYFSLPHSGMWHFAGHGGRGDMLNTFLVLGDDAFLYGDDIPDLTHPGEFGNMRFAFANACWSGCDDGEYDLHDGFIDNGCVAYLGWDDEVNDEEAYVWATSFYDLALTYGCAVWQAALITQNWIVWPGAHFKIYGNSWATLIP